MNGKTLTFGEEMKHAQLIRLIGIALIACCTTGCSRKRVTTIPDPTKPTVVTLTGGNGSPSGVSIRITGEIDGTAEVYAGNWDRKKLSGVVDWQIYHDWFEPTCDLHYEPSGVSSGSLTIEYTIH